MTFKSKFTTLLCLMVLAFSVNHCSSSATAEEDDDTDSTALTESASAAVTALFGGSDASTSESVAQNFMISQTFRAALATASINGRNCDEIASGNVEGNITFTNDGTDGSYGPDGDAVIIDGTTEAFCDDDGEWSTYEFVDGQSEEFTCSDASTFFMSGGSGIWRETDVGTEVAGAFQIASDAAGTDAISVNCHGYVGGESSSAVSLNCVDASGNAITETTGLTCESASTSSTSQGDSYSSDGSCTSDSECNQTDLPAGIGFVECRDFGVDGAFCMYSCTEDSQCQELSGSAAFCSIDTQECE